MRVLDTTSGQFVDIDPGQWGTRYAILSHAWDPEGEQTYQELRDIQKRYVPGNHQGGVHWWWWIARLAATALPSTAERDQNEVSPTSPSSQPSHNSSSTTPVMPGSFLPPDTTLSQPLLSPIWADPDLSPKIREACRVAREKGYQYLWIDSCCIDKTSSSELSESINSMYQWYARAYVCYAFLPDVPAEEDHEGKDSYFRRSRWFGRGWTLQELIAPMDVVFLSMEWKFIGSKFSLGELVTEITNIAYNALLHIEPLDEFSVAQRLSWASRRQTTRVEDRAYSLLGLFDINMPTLYGEGERAFRRLQEEILRRTPDQSLFAWTSYNSEGPDPSFQFYDPDTIYANEDSESLRVSFVSGMTYGLTSESLLAPSLDEFSNCAGIEALSHNEVARRLQLPTKSDLPVTDYDFTPYGIRMQLPVISFSSSHYYPPECVEHESMDIPFSQWYLVILRCGHKDFPGHLLGRVCYLQSSGSSIKFLNCGHIAVETPGTGSLFQFDLLPLSPATITRVHSEISMKTLYIPQPQRDKEAKHIDIARRKPHETIKLVLLKKTRDALSAQGYTATLQGPGHAQPATHLLTLSHDTHTITIDYQHTLDKTHWSGQGLTIEVHVKMSGPILQDAPGDLRVSQVDGLANGMDDFISWHMKLPFRDVELNTPGPMLLTLRLGLTFATTNHYLLDIELVTPTRSRQHSEPDGRRTRSISMAHSRAY
ncbi:HET-domain-containing protein [Ganoderma leucocontextum]|nr:HET-domain-containing protein [Ganoderma leucocontextum]